MFYVEYCIEFYEYYVIDSNTGLAICTFGDHDSAQEYAYNMNMDNSI